MKNIVFFHEKCNDGLLAAYALHKARPNDDFIYFPLNHKSLLEVDFQQLIDRQTMVYVLDMVFTPAQYRQLVAMDKVLLVETIDHHVSEVNKIKDLQEFQKLSFHLDADKQYSACVMTYEYYHGFKQAPLMYHLVQDRDIWLNQMPESKAFCTYFNHHITRHQNKDNIPLLFEKIDELNVDEAIEKGELLLDFYQGQIDSLQPYPVDFEAGGVRYSGYACNTWKGFSSEAGAKFCRLDENRPFALMWYFDGQQYYCSLRSRDDYDISPLAVHFGGGGHKQACAFKTNSLDFLSGSD